MERRRGDDRHQECRNVQAWRPHCEAHGLRRDATRRTRGVPAAGGPPPKRSHALREAVASSVNHVDASDCYGPYLTNELIRQALHHYPGDLVIVTKIGARRGDDASWLRTMAPAELASAVRHYLGRLGLTRDPLAERRVDRDAAQGSGWAFALYRAQRRDSDADRRGAANLRIARVQNMSNVAHRQDDGLIDDLARAGIPRGGSRPALDGALRSRKKGSTPRRRRSRPSSVERLRENLAAASLELPNELPAALDRLAAGMRRPNPDRRCAAARQTLS
jgi:aryl-alcohol dehydrogenase-like predicted oxidoreductase